MIFNFLTENWFEIVAALLAIAYLLLAMRQDARCWIAWIISSLMYLFVMYSAGLYMEAGLQIFYLLMGFYGLYQWQYKLANNETLKIKVWPITTHMMCLTALFLLVITLQRSQLFFRGLVKRVKSFMPLPPPQLNLVLLPHL